MVSTANAFRTLVQNQQNGIPDQRYLLGLRGLLTAESFLWVYLITFAPAMVSDDSQTTGLLYQTILRKSLSVLFWNETLIYSAFILLSARTICLHFLKCPNRTSIAGACFRRNIRFVLPVAVGLAIVKICFSIINTDYIDDFISVTENNSISTPYKLRGTVAFFNSVFGLFWTTFNYSSQAGSKAFPSGTLWVVNVIYAQSFTVYMTMAIIPYTRPRWRVQAWVLFIITAWWVQSWAWYSITGLALADGVVNMGLRSCAQRGIRVWKTSLRVPVWIPSCMIMAVGLVLQYLWTAWRPQSGNVELIGHAGLYYSSGLNTAYDVIQPQARDDNYVFLLGFFLAMECSVIIQHTLSNPLFIYLGSRSLSFFMVQSILMYTAGIKLYMIVLAHYNSAIATGIVFVVMLAAVVPAAETFYRLVDLPSRQLSYKVFDWIRD